MEANGRRLSTSSLTDLVIITGLSGAGKSLAMQVFEDAGYFCVDNLPAEMIRSLSDLFMHSGSKVERACVVSDLRGGTYFEKLAEVVDELREAGISHRVLFLTADDEAIVTRYKETRRRHPLAQEGAITDGITRERKMLDAIRGRADYLIDTTGMSASALRRKLSSEMLTRGAASRLAITFMSFGFKHGPARDADLLLDVRFLPNPHYEGDLRPLTGFDKRVVDYVGRDGRLDEFYERATSLLDYLLPNYVGEGKSHLVVAIGCTGGRHRSVTIAEHLADRYRADERYFVEVQHRDVDRLPVRA